LTADGGRESGVGPSARILAGDCLLGSDAEVGRGGPYGRCAVRQAGMHPSGQDRGWSWGDSVDGDSHRAGFHEEHDWRCTDCAEAGLGDGSSGPGGVVLPESAVLGRPGEAVRRCGRAHHADQRTALEFGDERDNSLAADGGRAGETNSVGWKFFGQVQGVVSTDG